MNLSSKNKGSTDFQKLKTSWDGVGFEIVGSLYFGGRHACCYRKSVDRDWRSVGAEAHVYLEWLNIRTEFRTIPILTHSDLFIFVISKKLNF